GVDGGGRREDRADAADARPDGDQRGEPTGQPEDVAEPRRREESGGDARGDDRQHGEGVGADSRQGEPQPEQDDADAQQHADAQPQPGLVDGGDADGVADEQAEDDGDGHRADGALLEPEEVGAEPPGEGVAGDGEAEREPDAGEEFAGALEG